MSDNAPATSTVMQSVLTAEERHQLLVRANYPLLQEEPRAYLVKITEELVLSKLRAPVADERAANPHIGYPDLAEAWQKGFNDERPVLRAGSIYFEAYKEGQAARAALASAPVAGEAQEDLAPPKCPITGRPFFMALEHPELGMVPTYGGPYDSYTIPHLGGKPDQPWHERDLRVYRYDHDLGGWIADEAEVIPLRIVHEDVLHGLEDAAPQASEAVRVIGIDLGTDGIADVRNATLEEISQVLKNGVFVSVEDAADYILTRRTKAAPRPSETDVAAFSTAVDYRRMEDAPQAGPAMPEIGGGLINDACWKFVAAMPHKLPGPIWNDLKPALHAAICHVLAARQQPAGDAAYIAQLSAALTLARDSHGVSLLTDPPQDAWKARGVDDVIRAALSAQPGVQKEQGDA